MNDHDPVLLAVMAHPDDESFGPGGTLALYARRGVQVHLICATGGEVGMVDPEHLERHDSIRELRQAELRCAVEHLGLASLTLLGYRDSGMPGTEDNQNPDCLVAAPLDQVVEKITHIIRQRRPQVVMTFDPIGGYFHPDHIRVHEATLEAFHAAGDPGRFPAEWESWKPQKLYYHTFPRRFLSLGLRIAQLFGSDPRRWGRNQDIDLMKIAEQEFPIHARVDYRSVVDIKEQASACHASQMDPGMRARFWASWIWRLLRAGNVDTYMRAYPQASNDLRERDLFEGLESAPAAGS